MPQQQLLADADRSHIRHQLLVMPAGAPRQDQRRRIRQRPLQFAVGFCQAHQILARLQSADEEEKFAGQFQSLQRWLDRRGGQRLKSVINAMMLHSNHVRWHIENLNQIIFGRATNRQDMIGALDRCFNLSRIIAAARCRHRFGIMNKAEVVHGDDMAFGGSNRRDKIRAVQQVQPVPRELDRKRRPFQRVMWRRPELGGGKSAAETPPGFAALKDGKLVAGWQFCQSGEQSAGVTADAAHAIMRQPRVDSDMCHAASIAVSSSGR